MDLEAEEMRNALIEWVKEDDNFFSFIMWCLATGIRQAMEDMEKGVEDENTQALKQIYSKLDLSKLKSLMH